MVTRNEYENEIKRIQALIAEAQETASYHQRKQQSDQQSRCAGMDNWCGGITCCERWKRDRTKINNANETKFRREAENLKQQLWDYQKSIAQQEQDAQVKAIREAIADQVRLEQEKIKQQQQITIQETVIPQPRIIEPPRKETQFLEVDQTQRTQNQSSLLPLAIVAGVLLL